MMNTLETFEEMLKKHMEEVNGKIEEIKERNMVLTEETQTLVAEFRDNIRKIK